ncbi:MAG: adenosylcobinamide-phosphate synthase CbiB [Pseudomonadota bacterium]
MSFALLMFGALVVEGLIGWPKILFNLIRHPVVWIGTEIRYFEKRLNRPERQPVHRKILGGVTTLIVVASTVFVAHLITALLAGNNWGSVGLIFIASSLIATRSLFEHVNAVATALDSSDLPAARTAVSRIVGRDPKTLDSPAIARASIESLAENASDGVVAPVFWGLIFGLPGLAAYKAINTLDSMIGHHGTRYGEFGWASARLDDLANWIPARLTALLFVCAARSRAALTCVLADARLHRSPNAGWPESAMAGALGVRVSGPRVYLGKKSNEPWVNANSPDPTANNIRGGLRIYLVSISLIGSLIGIYALLSATTF